jgi:hypothetical protein
LRIDKIQTAAPAANTAPTVSNPVSNFSVNEDAASSTFDLTNIFSDAEDTDSDLTFSVVSNSNSSLVNASVDNGTDQLTLDYQADQSGSADITIRAEDSGSLTVDDVFTVIVNNLAPVFNSSNTASFAENGTGTVLDVSADNGGDGANDSGITYSFGGGADDGAFNLDASTGELTFTSAPDFENPTDSDGQNDYVVQVTADDGESSNNTTTQTITVTVTDVNEAPTATTNAASGITVTAATLNGTASTGGGPDATVEFEYYVTADGSGTATTVNATPNTVTSAAGTPVSATPTGLQPNTQYTFEVIADSDEGTTRGGTQTFTTSAAPEINVTDGTNPLPDGSGTFDFGTVDGVASDPAQTFTIENSGSANLTVSSVSSSNTTDFTLTQAPSSPVGAGASTDFIVQFDAAAGPYSTTVTIANNDSDEDPYTFTVEATAGAPEADVFVETSPSRTALPDGGTFDFGTVTAGASATETFTIENNGDATLTAVPPSSIPGVFDIPATGGTTPPLAPGQSFTFDVRFTPSGASAFSESFSVDNSDPDEDPYNVTLTGTGAARDLTITDGSASGLDFDASVAPGTANNAVGIIALSTNAPGAALEALTITSNAPGISGISAARLFGSDDATLDVGSDPELASVATDNTSAPETIAFTGFSDPIPTSTRYLILAIDVEAGASAQVEFELSQDTDLSVPGGEIATVNGQSASTFAALPLSNGATALPVELTEFAGTTTEGTTAEERRGEPSIQLQWATASETGNAGFEVQRRADSTAAWTVLGFVEGAGTTDAPQTYRFRDPGVPFAAEQLTYRLRQLDADGTESFSAPVTVELPAPEAATLQAPFPNPAQGAVTLRVALAAPTEVQIQVYDLLGRRVTTLAREQMEAGRHELQVPTHDLASGTYFVRMVAGDAVQTQRLTIVR